MGGLARPYIPCECKACGDEMPTWEIVRSAVSAATASVWSCDSHLAEVAREYVSQINSDDVYPMLIEWSEV